MRRTLLLVIFLALALEGCKGLDKKVVGSWTSQQGMKLTVAEDRTFQTDAGLVKATGNWRVEGEDVVFVPGTINGRPTSEIRMRLQQRVGSFPAARQAVVKRMLNDLEKPNYLKLSSDGKTLMTDPAKDKNESPWSPLTRQ